MTKFVETSIAYFLDEIMSQALGVDRSDSIFIVETEEEAQKWTVPIGTVGYNHEGKAVTLGQGEIIKPGRISFPLLDFIEWTDELFHKISEYDEEVETGFSMGIVSSPSKDGWFDYPVGTIFLAGYRDSIPIGEVQIVKR